MSVFPYVLASLYSLKLFGICFEILAQTKSTEDVTSNNLHDQQIYLETTEILVNESFDSNISDKKGIDISYAEDFVKPGPVISDPIFENSSNNTSADEKLSQEQIRKRDIPERGLSRENEMQLLQLHNLYRSNVTPPAGNMVYMEWDNELARLAQIWADGCSFEHGMPDNDYPEPIGQNLYIGTDPTGYLGLYLWYEEYQYYNLQNEYCIPGKQCGHFVQMAWHASNKLGCGMTKCDMRYFLTCHYSPQALKGIQMYRVAKPCSQCPEKAGTLCLKNLCITREQCKNNPFDCQFAKCELECLNCGRLDEKKCLCECADGWDSTDCSYVCKDKHKRCGMSPGWPTKASCALNNYAVAETYCRAMCDKCQSLDTSGSNNTCCDGKLCDEGYVLDPYHNTCKCKLFCPGAHCDGEDAGEHHAALESSISVSTRNTCITHWIIIFSVHCMTRIPWKNL